MNESTIGVAKDLLARSEVQISNHRDFQQMTGAKFNLFKILRRTTDEVNGHSSFIAELLNSKGSHGMGQAFLDLFLDLLGIGAALDIDAQWHVDVEKVAGEYGRLDILLTASKKCGRRLGIAIENKIHAEDGDRQLYRYHDYLARNFDEHYLYYLTLSGEQPSPHSCSDIPRSDRQWDESGNADAPVRLLSYSYHITEWLKPCLEKASRYPYVRESISQYLDLVNSLAGNGGTMTEALLTLLDTPERLAAASKLSGAVATFKERTVIAIWDKVQKDWAEHGSLPQAFELNRHSGNLWPSSMTKEYFSKQRNVPRWFGIAARAYDFKGRRVGVEVRFDGHFYVGLYGDKEDKVLDIEDVTWFYANFQVPLGCTLGDFDPAAKRERVYVKSNVEFNRDTQDVFDLVTATKREELVKTILNLAESIVAVMCKRGLVSRAS